MLWLPQRADAIPLMDATDDVHGTLLSLRGADGLIFPMSGLTIRARPLGPLGSHECLANEGPGGATWARPMRAQGRPQGAGP